MTNVADSGEPSAALLAYYKKRVDEFEVERHDLLNRINFCQASAAENHSLRVEVQKRAEEVRELQQALSSAHIHLFEERDRLLQLQAENDALRLQDVENKRRLQHLTSILEDSHPEGDSCLQQTHSTIMPGIVYPPKGKGPRGCLSGPDDDSGPRSCAPPMPSGMRYMQTVNADALNLKVESLQAQLVEQRQLFTEQLEALKQDRQLRQQDSESHRRNFQRQIEDLTTKIKRTEAALRSATTDYILARRDKQTAEARAVTSEETLQQERDTAVQQLAEQRATDHEQFEKAQSIHQEELEKCTSQLSKSLKKREMEYSQLESMHMAVKAELEQRVQELESKVSKSKEKVKQAEHRRAMDAEGFTNDVSLLRKQLSAVDRKLHQMRLQSRLEDDERLHGLLQKLEKKGAAVCDQNRSNPNVPRSTAGAVESLDGIKHHIAKLERRAQREALKPLH